MKELFILVCNNSSKSHSTGARTKTRGWLVTLSQSMLSESVDFRDQRPQVYPESAMNL